ncbi:MAG TPA: NAD(+)/NADH kinase [Candidatus Acidoferrales bacterium]|nr:NAD(+)/NADH kinase [Candidatus Acidoferrales bacterium]
MASTRMIRAAGIICKPVRDLVAAVVPPLIAWLHERKISVFIDEETHGCCLDLGEPVLARHELGARIDLLIVFGGDGTLLSAARALGGHDVPILAVNLGGLGFLTSVTLEELYPALEQVLAGNQRTSDRMMLDAEIRRDGKAGEIQCALNDAVANKGARARMLDFDLHVDGDHVGRYRADGLIVATPTGSTAYSLAAGGPIVDPSLDAFIITPICPHMLTNRPLVVPSTSQIDLDFTAASEPVYVALDGQISLELAPADRVRITKSAKRVALLRPPTKSYFQILRSKLRWGER